MEAQPARRNREARPGLEPESEAVPRWDYVASGEQLSPELEGFLASRAQSGDERARQRMIDANIALVVSIARQYANAHLEREDLIQEGMIGLCTAVERFEPERGFRFSTYATYWIKQRVLRALDRQGRLIRLPVDVGYAARRVAAVRDSLRVSLGREPSLEEMAPECGISPARLKAVLACPDEPVSLDAPVSEDGDPLTLDVPDLAASDPMDALLQEECAVELGELLQTLPARDRLVLEGRFGLRGPIVPLADLAEKLRITREGVRQIQRRALLRLRKRLLPGQLQPA